MNTNEIRRKLLAMFNEATRPQVQPIIDTLIDRATRDGKAIGRKESATMLEVLVLGGSDYGQEDLTALIDTLRAQ